MKIGRVAGFACLLVSFACGGVALAAGNAPSQKIAALVPPIEFSVISVGGMRPRQRLYGVATDARLYLLKLESIEPGYFEENLPAFDAMVHSLQVGPIKVRPMGSRTSAS